MCKYNYGCQCCGFSKCAQMWRHAIVHRGSLETVRESALEGSSVKIIRCSENNPLLRGFKYS